MLHVNTGDEEVAAEARGSTHITITLQFLLYLRLFLSLSHTLFLCNSYYSQNEHKQRVIP